MDYRCRYPRATRESDLGKVQAIRYENLYLVRYVIEIAIFPLIDTSGPPSTLPAATCVRIPMVSLLWSGYPIRCGTASFSASVYTVVESRV